MFNLVADLHFEGLFSGKYGAGGVRLESDEIAKELSKENQTVVLFNLNFNKG